MCQFDVGSFVGSTGDGYSNELEYFNTMTFMSTQFGTCRVIYLGRGGSARTVKGNATPVVCSLIVGANDVTNSGRLSYTDSVVGRCGLIRYCTFSNIANGGDGGAVLFQASSSALSPVFHISDCQFTNCSSGVGGGALCVININKGISVRCCGVRCHARWGTFLCTWQNSVTPDLWEIIDNSVYMCNSILHDGTGGGSMFIVNGLRETRNSNCSRYSTEGGPAFFVDAKQTTADIKAVSVARFLTTVACTGTAGIDINYLGHQSHEFCVMTDNTFSRACYDVRGNLVLRNCLFTLNNGPLWASGGSGTVIVLRCHLPNGFGYLSSVANLALDYEYIDTDSNTFTIGTKPTGICVVVYLVKDTFSPSGGFTSSKRISSTKGFAATYSFNETKTFTKTGSLSNTGSYNTTESISNTRNFSVTLTFRRTRRLSGTTTFSETWFWTETCYAGNSSSFSGSVSYSSSGSFSATRRIRRTRRLSQSESLTATGHYIPTEYLSDRESQIGFSPSYNMMDVSTGGFSQSKALSISDVPSRIHPISQSPRFKDTRIPEQTALFSVSRECHATIIETDSFVTNLKESSDTEEFWSTNKHSFEQQFTIRSKSLWAGYISGISVLFVLGVVMFSMSMELEKEFYDEESNLLQVSLSEWMSEET
jgi:hypothetical protein